MITIPCTLLSICGENDDHDSLNDFFPGLKKSLCAYLYIDDSLKSQGMAARLCPSILGPS